MTNILKDKRFIKNVKHLDNLGIILVGYFPYHTARIQCENKCLCLPRKFFNEFESYLEQIHICSNKSVYMCSPTKDQIGTDNFAIMFKDDYCIIGTWENVINY
jgi:hypothetical protein